MKTNETRCVILLLCAVVFAACRKEEVVLQPTQKPVGEIVENTEYVGFYLLNEGNMGSNKATLDYYDYTTAVYTKNIYAATNPNVVAELGDVGNDLKIYGNRLYAVINCSNFLEVMDARNAKHIGMVEIPNCRYVTFYGGRAYVSSYAGPVQVGGKDQLGYVAEIDTASLKVLRTVEVGFQPDEMAVVDGKMYVANSGGYRPPLYDDRLTVVDMATFKVLKHIVVEKNLQRVRSDAYGDLYVSSRGNYYGLQSKLFRIDTKTDVVVDTFAVPTSNLCIVGDSGYIYSTEWNNDSGENTVSYAILNVKTEQVVSRRFITDGTGEQIKMPYGVAVNPQTREIFVTDAKNYVIPGTLYCFSPQGVKKWSVTTGDIPAHFAFLKKK